MSDEQAGRMVNEVQEMIRYALQAAGHPMRLPEVGSEVRVDHDMLKTIHAALADDLARYDSWEKGTLKDFTDADNALVTAYHIGHYPAARGLVVTCGNAYNVIRAAYDQFLFAYESLVNVLDASAKQHVAAEQASQEAVNRAGIV